MAGNPSDLTLKVEDLHLSFGKVKALEEVNLVVRRGEILSLIGPNGAGKTSLLNCISGFYHPWKGKISFEGKDITHMPDRNRTKLGIGVTLQ